MSGYINYKLIYPTVAYTPDHPSTASFCLKYLRSLGIKPQSKTREAFVSLVLWLYETQILMESNSDLVAVLPQDFVVSGVSSRRVSVLLQSRATVAVISG